MFVPPRPITIDGIEYRSRELNDILSLDKFMENVRIKGIDYAIDHDEMCQYIILNKGETK